MSRYQLVAGLGVLLVWAASPAAAFAQRDLKDIPDTNPEIERQSFQVAEGFEVSLFAADPQIAKPVQMNFDARGRLWIASSATYPHILPGQEASDKILIVEDTDRDGVADQTTVFADGLLIPTGVEPGDGGAYVGNSTELVHLKDTDNDGKADTRRVLLSGFGTEDTHHILHTFRFTPDGRLCFNQSIYIHSHIETPWGVRRLGGGGIWQLRPETLQLDILARGFVNPWGHDVDDYGQSFATDGAYGEGVNYVFPGSVFVAAPGARRLVKGLNAGCPKHCGLEIVGGTHLPDDWQGNMLTNDFRGHRVCRFVVTEDGSGYASREQPELIKTNHVAFRPIDIKLGPDGAIYIADWYNPIIQHGEVDFRDPRRDHTHGRIWRVTCKGRPLAAYPALADAEVPALLESLKSPEPFVRRQAKRVLKERGEARVLPALIAWVKGLDAQDPRVEHHRLEALWTCQSVNAVLPDLLDTLLTAEDARVRAAAIRVLQEWEPRLPHSVDRLAPLTRDRHPRVRLEAIRALARLPGLRPAELAIRALELPVDEWLDFALWQTARDTQAAWLPAVESGQFDFNGDLKQLTFALQAVGTPGIVSPLIPLLREGKVPASRQESVLNLIGTLGGPPELRQLWDLALEPSGAGASRRDQILKLLVTAASERKVAPSGDLSGGTNLFEDPSESVRQSALRLAGLWKVGAARERLEAVSRQGRPELQTAAFAALADLGGDQSQSVLEEAARGAGAADLRLAAARELARLNPAAGARAVVSILAQASTGDAVVPTVEFFLSQKGGTEALATALADKELPADVAKLAVRAVQSSGRSLPELSEALSHAGRLKSGSGMPQTLTAEQMSELMALVKEKGDPARGEAVYRRNELNCQKCHAVSGAGGQVGPDLASIGASAPLDYLIDSLLLPNKAIKENYHSVVVVTNAGRTVSGIKVRQTDTDLILRNADDQEVHVPLADIDEQAPAGSLMPAGLADSLTRPELIDLLRFLSELGKLGPYGPNNARIARRWQQLLPPAKRSASVRTPAELMGDPSLVWAPIYTRVSGGLWPAELTWHKTSEGETALVRCELQVTTPGLVELRWTTVPAGAKAWVDGKGQERGLGLRATLDTGTHTVVFALPSGQTEFRCELVNVSTGGAQVQFVSGK